MIKSLHELFSPVIINVLDAIIARSEIDSDYPFLDTKINTRIGKDLYPAAPGEEYKNKDVIFSWIQGRGLEALAGHAKWLEKNYDLNEKRINSIRRILVKVIAAMEDIRKKNSGRMFFIMRQNGEFLQISDDGGLLPLVDIPEGSNYSDLFYSKGLLTAAAYLEMTDLVNEAEIYFERVVNDIMEDRFISDQQQFDPANKVKHIPGKHLQGPWMISLGGMAAAAGICDSRKWLIKAMDTIEHIFKVHTNTGQYQKFEKYDFWEAVDSSGLPYEENGQVLSDPGHALEFVGLAMKCILQMKSDTFADADSFIDKYKNELPLFLKHNFAIGYRPEVGGIIKGFDLNNRKIINSDMPWWSLPETMRAVAEIYKITGDESILQILYKCADSFLDNYVNPAAYYMAYQTRNAKGEIVDVIPATPDADPGYHTGLSLIDTLDIFSECNSI